jgi:NNP family nitrate/nitrite transporter-like MFS transporter
VVIGFGIESKSLTFPLLFLLMGVLGMGNGSVFQLIPQRFKKMGVMTGLVGAAGGEGGYYLNQAMGSLHDVTNTYGSGFFAYAGIAVVAVVALRLAAPIWQRHWLGQGGVAKAVAPHRERILVGPDGADLELA